RRSSACWQRSGRPGEPRGSTFSTRSPTSNAHTGSLGSVGYPSRMPRLTLPDGTQTELPDGEPVGSALPPGSIAARVDGELRDLSYVPAGDVTVEPVDVRTDDGLHILRHSTAHVLAQAVCRLWPGTKYAIGPAIADGFYYDFALPTHLSADDLPAIQYEMRSIVEADQPFV